MVEQHLGKKRLRAVRHAASLNDELKRLAVFIGVTLVLACILVALSLFAAFSQTLHASAYAFVAASIIIVLIAVILVVPKVKKYRALHDEFEQHCERFNISKEDMGSVNE